MEDLRRAGFTFVRLAVDPSIIDGPVRVRLVLLGSGRAVASGTVSAVIVSPHAVNWNFDTTPADRARLTAFWRELAPPMRALPAAMTFPEVLNEPVFHDDPGVWWNLQGELHAAIRAVLPDETIILTGQDWGSIAGLLAMALNHGLSNGHGQLSLL